MMGGRRLIALCVMAALLCGCGTETRYEVLSFFFDGVPAPEQQNGAKGPGKTANGARAKGSVHGPYAAKMCNACHERGTNALVAPVRELCFRCHQIKMDKKWVHGPLASGGCRFCHDPHRSGNRFLLVFSKENPCFYCHDQKAIENAEYHKGTDPRCVSCHDAHMSDKKYLLK